MENNDFDWFDYQGGYLTILILNRVSDQVDYFVNGCCFDGTGENAVLYNILRGWLNTLHICVFMGGITLLCLCVYTERKFSWR